MKWNNRSPVMLAVAASMTLAGCASDFIKVAPTPPQQFVRLGKATGSACGSLGVDGTSLNFVPIALNGRVARAYNNALESVPGATGLVDVTIQENWYWWVIATARCVTVTGEAIK